MDVRGAWLFLQPDLHNEEGLIHFEGDKRDKHINWKETATALRALERARTRAEPKTEILIALDNTTAVAVINAGRVPWCRELDEELHALIQAANKNHIAIRAVHVAGVDQPADEPSRLQAADPNKIATCIRIMTEVESPWWTQLSNHKTRAQGANP